MTYDSGPDVLRLSEQYDIGVDSASEAAELQRLESDFGTERVQRWADEGMSVATMGKPRDMQAFREQSSQEPVPADIDPRNRASLQRNTGRSAESEPAGDAGVPDEVRRVISSPGTSMDEPVQREMESKMGGDFDDVRIHTGPGAAVAADSIGARAFTVGNHVAFNRGEYRPGADGGKKVLAHELTHVRQQTAGRVSLLPKAGESPPGGMGTDGVRIQAKLEVSSPDDPAEKEAESVAEAVMAMDDPAATPSSEDGGHGGTDAPDTARPCGCERCLPVRRATATARVGGSSSAASVRRATTTAHPTAETGGTVDSEREATVRSGVRGSGKPLPSETQSRMESAIGADFSDVQVHTGPTADAAARSIDAKAYTMGSDIAFASGNYSPDSADGKELLAHELTHVAQEGAVSRVHRETAGINTVEGILPRLPTSIRKKISESDLKEAENPINLVVERYEDELAEEFRKASPDNQCEIFKLRFNADLDGDLEANERTDLYEIAEEELQGVVPSGERTTAEFIDVIFGTGGPDNEQMMRLIEIRYGFEIIDEVDIEDEDIEEIGSEKARKHVSEMIEDLETEEGLTREEVKQRFIRKTLDDLYESYGRVEDLGLLDDADIENVVMEIAQTGGWFNPSKSEYSDERTMAISAWVSESHDAEKTTLHELGHAVDYQGGGIENRLYSTRGDFAQLSNWDYFEGVDAILSGLVDGTAGELGNMSGAPVDDPYSSIWGYDFWIDDEDKIDKFAKGVLAEIDVGGEMNPYNLFSIASSYIDVPPAERNDDVPDEYSGYVYMARVNLIDAILRAQAANKPYLESNIDDVKARMSGTLMHQGYSGQRWWSYDESNRSNMLKLMSSGYASRTASEEFAEVFAHGILQETGSSTTVPSPYDSWWNNRFMIELLMGNIAISTDGIKCGD